MARFRNARGATGGKNDRAAVRRTLAIFRNGDSPLPSARFRTNSGLAKVFAPEFSAGDISSIIKIYCSYDFFKSPVALPVRTLQRGGMLAFVDAIRMPRAALCGQAADRRIPLSAIFAGVLRFFISFIKFMLAFVNAIRMARAALRRQRRHTRKPLSAVLAIVVRHFPFPFLLFMIVAGSTAERRVAPYKAKSVPSRFASGHPTEKAFRGQSIFEWGVQNYAAPPPMTSSAEQ